MSVWLEKEFWGLFCQHDPQLKVDRWHGGLHGNILLGSHSLTHPFSFS